MPDIMPDTIALTAPRWFAVFFSSLLGTAALLLLGALYSIHIVRRPGYPRTTGDPSVELQDSGFRLRGQRCDILVYGDSTANVGIDPRILTANIGLSACNIATNRPDVDDLGTLPLDAFLSHNPKPRLIVLQFGPEDFYRARSPWAHVGPYTPLVMLARNLPTWTVLAAMLRHPAEAVQFEEFILQREILPTPHNAGSQYQRMLDYAAASHGQLSLELPPMTHCSGVALPLYGPLDAAWPAAMRRRYQTRGIPVLIRAAPVPRCDPQLAKFRQDLRPYLDGDLETLPPDLFAAGYRHTTQAGSQAGTLGLVALIRANAPGLIGAGAGEPSPIRTGEPSPIRTGEPSLIRASEPSLIRASGSGLIRASGSGRAAAAGQ